nr:hypothetical protein [Tanacetum cinerariifolium]
MEEDFEPAVQHQRRVNPKIYNVIKNEGGFTVVKNEENELILTRSVTRWHVFIDYRMDLAKLTKKWPKPDKIEHEIEKIAQKPDPKAFSVH